MKGLVLAAGRGTRLKPLTNRKPKALVEIGKKSLIEYIIEALEFAGIDEISIVKGYMGDKLEGDLKEYSSLEFIEQGKQLGTAHAIGMSSFDEPFLMINGDVFMDKENIRRLLEGYDGGEAEAVIGSREVDDPQEFGVLEVNGEKVVGIHEKPEEPPSKLINTGLYIFTPRIYDYIEKTSPSQRGEYEITDSLKMMIKDGLEVTHARLGGYWIDVGRPEDLEEAKKLAGEMDV